MSGFLDIVFALVWLGAILGVMWYLLFRMLPPWLSWRDVSTNFMSHDKLTHDQQIKLWREKYRGKKIECAGKVENVMFPCLFVYVGGLDETAQVVLNKNTSNQEKACKLSVGSRVRFTAVLNKQPSSW